MCGICGAMWTDSSGALKLELLKAMMSRLVHRGPDDSGDCYDNHAALAHVWGRTTGVAAYTPVFIGPATIGVEIA
jgi:asparagine synthetase B (glutamine-hydrolysing)